MGSLDVHVSYTKPSTEEPATEEPVAEPVTEEPVAEEPVAEEPVAEESVAESSEEPAAEPVTEEPATEEPATEEPAVDQELEASIDIVSASSSYHVSIPLSTFPDTPDDVVDLPSITVEATNIEGEKITLTITVSFLSFFFSLSLSHHLFPSLVWTRSND